MRAGTLAEREWPPAQPVPHRQKGRAANQRRILERSEQSVGDDDTSQRLTTGVVERQGRVVKIGQTAARRAAASSVLLRR